MEIKLVIIDEIIKCETDFYNKMIAKYGPSSLQALLSSSKLEGMKSIQNILNSK